MNNRRYFPVLDGMRGIAALFVVARHADAFFGGNPFAQSYLAVDVFFVLSGVVLYFSYEHRLKHDLTFTSFVITRLLRIYPLYVLGSLIGLLAFCQVSSPTILSLLLAGTMLPELNFHRRELFPFDGPAWTLSLEILGSIAYGLVGFRTSTHRLVALAVGMLVVLCLLLIAMPEHSLDLGWSNHTFVGGVARLAFSFTLGVCLGRAAFHTSLPVFEGAPSSLAAWMLLLAIGAILAYSPAAGLRWLYDFISVAFAFPLIVWLSLMLQPSRHITTLCRWLGLISFPIYAIHQPVARLLRQTMSQRSVEVTDYAPFSGFLLLLGLIVIAVVIDPLYDSPLRRWGAKLIAVHPHATTPVTRTQGTEN